jgi:hypothetical protein
MDDETGHQADLAIRRQHLVQQGRATARRLAEAELHLAEVEEQVARTHDRLADQLGDPVYRERAADARGVAEEARRAAAREQAAGQEP